MAETTELLITDPLPAPGVYPGVPMREYMDWPCMNASTLVQAFPDGDREMMSMARLKAAIDGRLRDPTPAMQLGQALHMRLLEPDKFAETYSVAQPCVATIQSKQSKNYGKPCGRVGEIMYRDDEGSWFCHMHSPGGIEPAEDFLDPDTAAAIEEIVETIAHRKAVQLLKALGGCEVSYVWDQAVSYVVDGEDHQTVIRMKCRVDKDLTGLPQQHPKMRPLFVDLKKVSRDRWTDREVLRAIFKYCYDIKAALYLDGARAVDGVERQWIWLALEDTYPYHTNPLRASDEMLAVGRAWYNRVLSEYAKCRHLVELDESFRWPVACEDIHWCRDPWWSGPHDLDIA